MADNLKTRLPEVELVKEISTGREMVSFWNEAVKSDSS
jgi:hypothetical protein